MMNGRVLSFWADRSYGFVESESGESFFFHRSDLPHGAHDPEKGQPVTFDVAVNPRNQKKKAFRVRLLTAQEILGGGQ
jgi:cold shock CspA family protein